MNEQPLTLRWGAYRLQLARSQWWPAAEPQQQPAEERMPLHQPRPSRGNTAHGGGYDLLVVHTLTYDTIKSLLRFSQSPNKRLLISLRRMDSSRLRSENSVVAKSGGKRSA